MPRFCANISLLYPELPFPDRIAAAARSGFSAIELQFPYEYEAGMLAERLRDANVELVLHNLPPGNAAKGERGIACLPGREQEFREGLERGIEYARTLGCKQLNCLSGLIPESLSREEALATLAGNLRHADATLKKAGIRLLVEAINTYDVPGFAMHRSQQVLDLIAAHGLENTWLQYDVYHMQRMEGELARTLEDKLHRIAHIQIADNPGRHEPGTGEIRYPYLFELLDRLDYSGWIGCEYIPLHDTDSGLGWMPGRKPA